MPKKFTDAAVVYKVQQDRSVNTCWHETHSVLVVVVAAPVAAEPVVAAPVVAVVMPDEAEAPRAAPEPDPPDKLNTT